MAERSTHINNNKIIFFMTENNNEKNYKIKIEGGSENEKIEINQSVSRYTALKALNLLMSGDNLVDTTGNNASESTEITIKTGNNQDPKTFMAIKKPTSDVERITCLAYYLSFCKGITQYKTRELTDLNIEAAQPRFSNATVAARNAVQQQYLVGAGGGKKQITTIGEAIVKALPDRVKVKEALEQNTRVKRHKKTKKTTKKEKETNN